MKIHSLIAASCLLFCTPALADVTVYRAVDRKNATFAKIADNQWRIDDDGLSTFEAANFTVTNKACRVSFVIEGVASAPAEGTQGNIKNMQGYVGVYTPQHGGEGHWSIQAPTGTVAATAQTAITNYVIAQQVASVNAGYTGGSPSQCNTPAQAN